MVYSSGIADSDNGISRISERSRGRFAEPGSLFSGMMPEMSCVELIRP
jgi:hypothetical protein